MIDNRKIPWFVVYLLIIVIYVTISGESTKEVSMECKCCGKNIEPVAAIYSSCDKEICCECCGEKDTCE